MGMSFQLLPIFQVTELYPRFLTRWLPLLIPGLLLAWTALDASTGLPRLMRETVELLLTGAYVVWIGTTLNLLRTRKRPAPEPTTLFWYAGMASLLACAPLWVWVTHGQGARAPLVLGTVLIVGGLGSVVNGMLYKIVPFLLWKHAQDAMIVPDHEPVRARVYLKILPKMAAYIPDRAAFVQWAAHVLMALAWALAAAGWELAALAAGPLLLLSAAALGVNLWGAVRLYRRTLRVMAGLPHHRQAQPAQPR
jgi:hypothetical protein